MARSKDQKCNQSKLPVFGSNDVYAFLYIGNFFLQYPNASEAMSLDLINVMSHFTQANSCTAKIIVAIHVRDTNTQKQKERK